jgi:hypothetical protein
VAVAAVPVALAVGVVAGSARDNGARQLSHPTNEPEMATSRATSAQARIARTEFTASNLWRPDPPTTGGVRRPSKDG